VDSDFLASIEQICDREEISLIVPTIDTELPIYAAARAYFKTLKVQIAISSSETVAISGDKQLTHEWLRNHGFPTPRQATPNEVLKYRSEWTPPLLVKPPRGSASTGVRKISSFDELEAVTREEPHLIVQEFLNDAEYTTNVFVDRSGKSLCAVPHHRIEVRAGEVSKGVTVRKSELIRLSQEIVEALPGAYGPLNIQAFVSVDEEIKIIEVNARFGGGYPLTHQAGAPMTRWLVEETLGWGARGPFDTWEDGLVMLRYDEAVFIKSGTGLEPQSVDSLYQVRSG
jgi:carbamoyl-phosphate synthase large subunit